MCPRWPPSRADIEQLLGWPIKNPALYQQAFVHRSAVKVTGTESNERLEFLGDAVISLTVNEYLYHKYPREREGFMTRLKTKLVSGACLASLAAKMGLAKHIVMNKKALDEGWCCNPNIMEDCLEALTGAVYLDLGFSAAKVFVTELLSDHIDFGSLALSTNGKDQLMFYTQQQKVDLPEYRLLPVPPDGLVKFAVQTFVDGQSVAVGTGQTKKEAEMSSARCALETLGVPHEEPREYVI